MTRLATVESIELVAPPTSGHISLTGETADSTAATETAKAASLREIAPIPHTAAAEAANVVAQQQQTSHRRRVAIATFVLLGNMVQMISNGSTVTAGFKLGEDLGVPDIRQSNWVAASYSLTQGTFVLVSGRLGSVYGHKNILLVGGFWFMLWSFLNIPCISFLSFCIARGFTGIGGALIAPNAVAMISITFPPGKMRNLCLGIFGAAAPIGGYMGAVFAGVFTQFTPWWYLFLFQGILAAVVFSMLWWILPHEIPVDRKGRIDWIGAGLGMTGLILFNFTWNQAPAVGWSNPYQIGILVASVVVLGIFALWESYSEAPIMPLDVWKAPSFLPLMLAVLMSFMSFGIMLWYMTAWVQLTRGWSVLHFAAGWTPFLFFGMFSAWLASHLIPRMSAQYILAIGLLSIIVSTVLIATMPEQQSYWKQVFPATILMSFCPDLVFTAAQIIASNSLPRSQQGVAASLVGVLMLYGNSLGLGFAGTIEVQVDKARYPEITTGYRAALWFGCGIAILALILDLWFVRMKKDEREGWADEDDYIQAIEHERAIGTGTDLQQHVSRGV